MKQPAAQIAVLFGAFAVLFLFTPPDLSLCGFRWITGRPCPLCGLTRALFALAKGHWREAIALHALSPVAALMLVTLVWDRSTWSRCWLPCTLAFAAYGAWRILA
jgi:hypothetical protein